MLHVVSLHLLKLRFKDIRCLLDSCPLLTDSIIAFYFSSPQWDSYTVHYLFTLFLLVPRCYYYILERKI